MADVRPFRGLRFDRRIGDLRAVLGPPNNVFSRTNRDALCRRSPYNIAWLEQPLDTPPETRPLRAGQIFRRWISEGVLIHEDRPAFYVIRQRFTHLGAPCERTGLLGLVRLESYDRGIVLPHELTITPPKKRRLDLMQMRRASLSPMLSLYRDPSRELRAVLAGATGGRPALETSDEEGVNYALWAMTDPPAVREVHRRLAGETLYIADGHHRYETGLAYREFMMRLEGGDPAGDHAANFIMMVLIEMEDPGLFILPYHRAVRGLEPEALGAVRARLDALFESHPFPTRGPDALVGLLAELEGRPPGSVGLALVQPGGAGPCLLTPRSGGPCAAATPGDGGDPLRACEAWLIQEHVMRPVLGDRFPHHLAYLHDARGAVEAVASGDAQFSLLLPPLPVDQFASAARQGLRLPPKATYVYPKLLTGMVIHRLEGEVPRPQ